ncbi:MAG: diacylglycerol kinase family lipid kinase [Bacteroidia bacterium]
MQSKEFNSEILNTWLFIVNPAAGGGKAAALCDKAEAMMNAAGIQFVRINTKDAGDAISISVKGISDGYRKILIGGGDGSLNEVLRGIMHQQVVASKEIVISQLPVGTGNDWRRSYGFSTSLKKSVEMLKSEKRVCQDIGKLVYESGSSDWFINSAGGGFDAQVAFAANEKKKQGRSGLMVYISALLGQLFSFNEPEFEVSINGEEFRFRGFTVLAGVGKYAGNGMKLIPHAGEEKGKLSIVLVEKISRLKIVFNILKLFSGKFTHLKEVKLFTCESLQLAASPEQNLQIDGESRGNTPVRIEIVPEAIMVLCE